MVAYVPDFEHDVFVSYAHSDNLRGWVTNITKQLEIHLIERLGGKPNPSVWIDHQILGNEPVDQITKIIDKTATLLLFLTPGYLKSDWCRGELLAFMKKQHHKGNEVFVVRGEYYEPTQCPEGLLRDLPGYDFFVYDQHTKTCMRLGSPETANQRTKYHKQLTVLAVHLAKKLNELGPIEWTGKLLNYAAICNSSL